MVALTLRAGKDHVVIGQDDTAGCRRSELLGVDGGDTPDEPIGWGLGDELGLRSTGALGGIGEPAVLDEAPLIDQVHHVLSCCPKSEGMPLGHPDWSSGILEQRLARRELVETIGTGRFHLDSPGRHGIDGDVPS